MRHTVTSRIRSLTDNFGTQTAHYAHCSCGWKGPGHRKSRLAYGDGIRHLRRNGALRPAPDYDPRIDYPERYSDGRPV